VLRVGIVGCGQIADSHASQIRRIAGCELVGVCDQEELMARQLASRFHVAEAVTELTELLQRCRPDVVHVTTPPQSHFALAKTCVEAGVHVYVEKPFTVTLREAEALVGLARDRDVKLCVGHDAQFSHAARRMRELIAAGFLGGPPVHMESTWCSSLGGHSYGRAVLGNSGHWVRALPGKLLQNIISHGVARLAEHLTGSAPEILALGFASPSASRLDSGDEIVDELRVVLRGESSTTAYFTFSSQMRPQLQQFRIFGPRNGLLLDENHQTLIALRGEHFKSYLDKFLPQWIAAGQYARSSLRNMRLFLARDFHMESSKKHLMEAFYASIAGKRAEVPIPYAQILMTARIMESIFEQIRAGAESRRVQEADTGLGAQLCRQGA
jgi:predicted dehydrogenase